MKKQSARRRVRGAKIRRKKMQVREKVGKLRITVVSNDLWKSRLAKAAGAEWGDEK